MSSLDCRNIAHIKARNLFDQRNFRSSWAPAIIVVGVAAAALFDSASTFGDPAGDSARKVQEDHACALIMGFDEPGELYDTCVRSLDNSLSELDQARLVSTDRRKCAEERLKPGAPPFADCVVDAQQFPAGSNR